MVSHAPDVNDVDRDFRLGQRLLLGGVGSMALVLGLGGALTAQLGLATHDAGGAVALAMFGFITGLPYLQWVVALPLAAVLHVQGRTLVARGVLRAAVVVFLGYGLMYGFCGGLLGLLSLLDGSNVG